MVSVLIHLTSRSPAMMTELRKLWWLLGNHDIQLRVRYIRSAANVPDRLSRVLASSDDFMLHPQEFRSLQHNLRACTVDRFASSEDHLLDRYNSRFLDPGSRGLDALSQPDEDWRSEVNWYHPPPSLLNSLVLKIAAVGGPSHSVGPALGGSLLDAATVGHGQPGHRPSSSAWSLPSAAAGRARAGRAAALERRGLRNSGVPSWVHLTRRLPAPIPLPRTRAGLPAAAPPGAALRLRYRLRAVKQAPWAAAMHAHLGRTLGKDSLGTALTTMVQSALTHSSHATYSTGVNRCCLHYFDRLGSYKMPTIISRTTGRS